MGLIKNKVVNAIVFEYTTLFKCLQERSYYLWKIIFVISFFLTEQNLIGRELYCSVQLKPNSKKARNRYNNKTEKTITF